MFSAHTKRSKTSILATAIFLAIRSASADVSFWTGGSGEWTDPVNWSTPAAPNAADAIAIFQTGGSFPMNTITLAAPVTVGQMILDGPAARYFFNAANTTGSLTFASTTGQATFLQTGAIGSGTNTLTSGVTLGTNLLITNDASGAFVFSGAWTGTGNLTVNRGEVRLTGNNASWSGNITINAGAISTSGNASSLGNPNAGTITVSPGASLDLSSFSSPTLQQFTKTLIIAGAGTTASPGAIAYGGNTILLGTLEFNGPTTLFARSASAQLHIGDLAGNATTASFTGTGPLTKAGPGILQINIPATYTGPTTIAAGILQFGTKGSIVGTGNITINTGATLKLSKPAGNSPTDNQVSPNSVILAGGTVSITTDISLAALLSPQSTSGLVSLDNNSTFTAGGTNVIDFSALPAGSVIRLGTASRSTLSGALSLIPDPSTRTLQFGGAPGTLTIQANIADTGPSATHVNFGQSGVFVLASASTYTGTTTINAGVTVTVTHPNALGNSTAGTTINPNAIVGIQAATAEAITFNGGSLTVTAPATGSFLIKAGTATFSGAAAGGTGPVTMTGGIVALNANWAGTVMVSGGTLTMGAGVFTPLQINGGIVNHTVANAQPITLTDGTLTVTAALNGPLTQTGGFVRQTGSGNFSANSYTFSGGRFSFTSNLNLNTIFKSNSLGGILSIDTAGTPFTAGGSNLLDFSPFAGTNFILGTATVSSLAPTLVLKPNAVTNTLNFGGTGNTGTLTIASKLQDFGTSSTHVSLASPGVYILSTANTFTGTTTISTLVQVNNASGLGAGTGTDADGTFINSGGHLAIGTGIVLPNEKLIINGGTVSGASNGPISINGPARLNGTFGGEISVSGPSTLSGSFSGPIQMNATSLISGTFSGDISGTGNFSTSAALLLSGSSSFTGTLTLLNGAIVSATTPTALGESTSPLQILSGAVATISAASSKSVQISGTGVLNVNGPYAGTVTMAAGRVNLNAPNSATFLVGGGVFAATVFGTGPIVATGGTIFLFSTASAMSGPMTLANTTVSAGSETGTSITSISPITVSQSVTLTTGWASNWTSNGSLTGSGILTVTPINNGYTINLAGPMNFQGRIITKNNVVISNATTSGTIDLGGWSVALNNTFHHTGVVTQKALTTYLSGSNVRVDGLYKLEEGNLVVSGKATLNHFLMAGGTLTGSGTLDIGSTTLDLRGGFLDFAGTLKGVTNIVASGTPVSVNGYATPVIKNLPLSFTGPITVIEGETRIDLDGTHQNTVNLASSTNAHIRFNSFFGGSLNMNNARDGQLIWGSDTFSTVGIGGTVNLGGQGSVLSPFYTSNVHFQGSVIGGSLTILGRGGLNLTLTGSPIYVGPTLVTDRGSLIVGGNARLLNTPSLTFRDSSFLVTNDGSSMPDRVPNATPVILGSSTLQLVGPYSGGTASTETIGSVVAEYGVNNVSLLQYWETTNVFLTISSINVSPGATVQLGQGQPFGNPPKNPLGGPLPTHPKIFFTAQSPTNYMGGAIIAGSDFLHYDATRGAYPFSLGDYSTGSENTWNAASNVYLPSSASTTLSASRNVNSMKFNLGGSGSVTIFVPPSYHTLSLLGHTLNVIGEGVLLSGSTISSTADGRLTSGGQTATSSLYLWHGGNISANITDNPGPDGLYDPVNGGPLDSDNGKVSLVLTGGTYHFSGNNTYTGPTYLNNADAYFDSPSAITGTGIFLSGYAYAAYRINGNFTADTGPVVMRNGTRLLGPGTVDAPSYLLEGGTITAGLVGNGPITKTTTDHATLSNLIAYSGSITVLGGSLLLPNATVSNSIFVQSATLVLSYNSGVKGALTLGDDSVLKLDGALGAIVYAPSSLTVGDNAQIYLANNTTLNVGGTADPFTDFVDPSRHLSVNGVVNTGDQPASYLKITSGDKNVAALGTWSVTVMAGASLTADSIQGSELVVNSVFKLRPGTKFNRINKLVVAGVSTTWTGTVDLANQTLIIEPTSNVTGTLSTLRSQIASGYHNGDWLGTGITSSTVAADASASGNHALALALFENSILGITNYLGHAVSPNALVITTALLGDTNFDNTINQLDFNTIASNWQSPQTSWSAGDLNYDGFVDILDYTIVATHWQATLPPPPAPTFATVPEPSTLALLAPLTLLLRRGRRKSPTMPPPNLPS